MVVMNFLFQKTLGITDEGTCCLHPTVTIYWKDACLLDNCFLCATEEHNESGTTEMSSFWSSASFSELATMAASSPCGQDPGKSKPEMKQHRQVLLDSILSRWCQLQELGLQKSIALTVAPLMLVELQSCEVKFQEQQGIIQQHEEAIQQMQATIARQSEATQEVLQSIVQSIKTNNNSPGSQIHRTNGITESPREVVFTPPVLKRRETMDSYIKLPSSRHAVNSKTIPEAKRDNDQRLIVNEIGELTLDDLKPQFEVSKMTASQPILFQGEDPPYLRDHKLHSSQPLESTTQEIALDGSIFRFSDYDLPDINAIFEEGAGKEMPKDKKKKFGDPTTRKARKNRKTVALGASDVLERIQSGAEYAEISVVGHTNSKGSLSDPPSRREIEFGAFSRTQISCVTLDTSFPQDPSAEFSHGDSGNNLVFEDLETVTRYAMTDVYGDKGFYTGTVGPNMEPQGFGTMKYESGRFFKGEWKNGRWHGKGTLLNSNGDSYQGDFIGDARHGKGIYRFKSGDVYEGDFFEDNRHGSGTFKFANGSVYCGELNMGRFEGQGTYTFDNGSYTGFWRRDEYDGYGILVYNDGSSYVGSFRRGSAHGYGEEALSDGTVRKGLWGNGEFIRECAADECKRPMAQRGDVLRSNRSIGSTGTASYRSKSV